MYIRQAALGNSLSSKTSTHCMLTRRNENVETPRTLLPIYFVHGIDICAEVILLSQSHTVVCLF